MINTMSGKDSFSNTISVTGSGRTSITNGLFSTQAIPARQNHHMNVYLGQEQVSKTQSQLNSFNPLASVLSPVKLAQRSSLTNTSNITFSYTSPSALRKNKSSEGRFSTKKFKDSRFPHLGKEGPPVHTQPVDWGQPARVNQTVMGVLRLMNDQQTPTKPRLLRMNKVKSKKSIEGTQRHPQLPLLNGNTPINTLLNQHKQKGDSNVQTTKQAASRDVTKADYEAYYYEPLEVLSGPKGKEAEQPLNQSVVAIEQPTEKKYPSTRSIEIFKRSSQSEEYLPEQSGSSVSLKVAEDNIIPVSQSHQDPKVDEDKLLAQSISQDLSLHYDYYMPPDGSDRSLSQCVSL